MIIKLMVVSALFIFSISAHANTSNKLIPNLNCRPDIDVTQDQYIIGYGSLMNEESKRKSEENVSDNIPIYLTGYERGWYTKTKLPRSNTIFLDVVKKPFTKINAVAYKLNRPGDILQFDKREGHYCRVKVDRSHVLVQTPNMKIEGQIWIYDSQDDGIDLASKNHPITQSYVDLFLTGCINLEEKHKLKNFARDCITTTHGWSKHWVNDRTYPRRPWVHTPKAVKIDKLLQKYVPQEFSARAIE